MDYSEVTHVCHFFRVVSLCSSLWVVKKMWSLVLLRYCRLLLINTFTSLWHSNGLIMNLLNTRFTRVIITARRGYGGQQGLYPLFVVLVNMGL